MTKPTDRLGQPLAVGDWVIFTCCFGQHREDGEKFKIVGFWGGISAYLDDGSKCFLQSLIKINPKPKTTTWDKCVWQPEGVKV